MNINKVLFHNCVRFIILLSCVTLIAMFASCQEEQKEIEDKSYNVYERDKWN